MIRQARQLLANVLEQGAATVYSIALRDIDANVAAGHRTVAPEVDVALLEMGSALLALAAKVAPR